MRADRLLSLLLLVQTRGRMTAQELADELEVSVRTVYRDVEALSAAGVPLFADRGPAGGYQLVDGYRTKLTGLTVDQAESLFLVGLPGPAAALGLGTELAAAELKLLAALPAELRTRAERMRERFHLDAPGWFREAEDVPHLAAVADAVWNQRRISARYRRWRAPREVDRVWDPLGVVLKAGVWYFVARSGREIRAYKVSHLLEVCELGERFERPEGFDLAAYWQEWTRRFEANLITDVAEVRISPAGLNYLQHLLGGPAMVAAARENAGPPDADGWVVTTIGIERIRKAQADFLALGADVEVLGPPELRSAVAEAARAASSFYADAAPAPSDRI
ncbi:helix-turn-helix transcriptional regulator [Cryptosporangium phraense]|uniref:WYL domain-containing protein n=1 Tax=Cryptosporangium phraense TaxID=2593070 RepID=A0A545AHU8_9ACTN|nr:WYL domain-containing protein [Cryptosporangium phraense]TQS40891.1 WYL domain-containing protein [Cryptosporangium phraense]